MSLASPLGLQFNNPMGFSLMGGPQMTFAGSLPGLPSFNAPSAGLGRPGGSAGSGSYGSAPPASGGLTGNRTPGPTLTGTSGGAGGTGRDIYGRSRPPENHAPNGGQDPGRGMPGRPGGLYGGFNPWMGSINAQAMLASSPWTGYFNSMMPQTGGFDGGAFPQNQSYWRIRNRDVTNNDPYMNSGRQWTLDDQGRPRLYVHGRADGSHAGTFESVAESQRNSEERRNAPWYKRWYMD